MSDVLLAGRDKWEQNNPFIFANGRTVPPDLLRDTPEQNYLAPALSFWFHIDGDCILCHAPYHCMGIHPSRAPRLEGIPASLLYVLVLGSMVSSSTIVTISNDEGIGWSDEQLDKACMATPWLLSLGHIVTYGARFSKLWRVNKVLQFVRRTIEILQVAWPSGLLVFVALLLDLSLWRARD